MEVEKLENEVIKITEQRESFSELDDSGLNAREENDEVVEEEEEKLPVLAEEGGKNGEGFFIEENELGGLGLKMEAVAELDMGGGERTVLMVKEAVAEETRVLESEVDAVKGGGCRLGSVVACDGSMIVTETGDLRHHAQLEMGVNGDEALAAGEGMEEWDPKAETEMEGERGEEHNFEKEEGAEMELEKTQIEEKVSETIVEDAIGSGEKVTVMINDSEIGTAEEPSFIIDEKGDFESQMEAVTVIALKMDVGNDSEGEQVHELDGGLGDTSAADKGLVDESLMAGTMTEDEKDMSMKVLNGLELSEPANAAEYKEVEAAPGEEIPAWDTQTKMKACVEIEVTGDDMVQEIQMVDAKIETEVEASSDASEKFPSKDTDTESEETKNDVDEPSPELDVSQDAKQDEEDEVVKDSGTHDTEMETETDMPVSEKPSGEKQKRGRNSKSSLSSKANAKASPWKVGEDVCFICFDGGDLVLCDRRGCPKAYHPSCVNRDEAFFKSKGRWNCGWHLCSICEKNAQYLCYTCTFSLCKSCIKSAVILCVRGNKGFCETCMKTIMIIEYNEQGIKDTRVDFNDKSSWEYLFKDYYLDLKSKLSLSSVEVAEAKHPWKGADVLSSISKRELPDAQINADDEGSGSDDSIESLETSKLKRRKLKKRSKSLSKEKELVSAGVAAGDEDASLSEDIEWASRELLEFVSHMRNGDTSMISQYMVQELLLEYIKRNKLRDPRKKSQIICDARLTNLFGKSRAGHFEVLKLIESHFIVKKDKTDEVPGSVAGTESNQLEVGGIVDTLDRGVKGRKGKTRKKGERRGPQSNLDDYAAINTHNISLIYLRRKLIEDLLEDAEKFRDKVVGAFVRIRISGSSQKQDLYRLVKVVGTSKAVEPYKFGKRTCDTMLDILNLDKAEVVSIDTLSNHEFTEEECKRLRQSIKFGFINRLSVGDILDKTMEIQTARVNDWLESETLRLTHLRDRASDLGRRKELRECVEKLQRLKSPEERQRRLEEIPEIHADPNMDPSVESDEDEIETEDSRRDSMTRSRSSSFNSRGRGLVSARSDSSAKDAWSGSENVPSKKWELSRNLSSKSMSMNASRFGEMVNESSWNQGRDGDVQESNNVEKPSSSTDSKSVEWNTPSRSESLSGASHLTSQASRSATTADTAVMVNETEKTWYYKDPSGKVQGPFSMAQLHKWNNTGYFPADLRIWRNTVEQENPILLPDALAGKYLREPATNTMHGSRIVSAHPDKGSGMSLHQDIQRPNIDQNPMARIKHSTEKWAGNDSSNLPSPTPKPKNAGWTGGDEGLHDGATQYRGGNVLLQSPTAAFQNTVTYSSPASVLNSAVQSGTVNFEKGGHVGSVDSLQSQSNLTSESPNVQMHGHLPAIVQPVHSAVTLNPLAETHGWGTSLQSGQSQALGWGVTTLDAQNSVGSCSVATAISQPDPWRPSAPGLQTSMLSPVTQNMPWGTGLAENNTSVSGIRSDNQNTGWGNAQVNPNMAWGMATPGSTNINVGPAVQVPAPGNTSSWVDPTGNYGAPIQGPAPGNVSSGWVSTPGWGASVHGPVPGNGWGPPIGNLGTPIQGPVPGNGWGPLSGSSGAGLAQGNQNQGWGAPGGSQGTWGGERNSGGQYSGQRDRTSRGGDSGFGGGWTWNGQSSFGSGGPGSSRPFNRREMVCPYNAKGRCRKGSRCDYRHI